MTSFTGNHRFLNFDYFVGDFVAGGLPFICNQK